MPEPSRVRFGVFEVDLHTRELRRQGARIKLQDQPFQVLEALIERPGGLVTRDELRHRIWGGDTFVDFDQGLNRAVNKLREALGDAAETPRFIETLPRRGYRFIAPSGDASGVGFIDAAPPAPVPVRPDRPSRRSRFMYATVASGVLFVLAVVFLRRPPDVNPAVALPLTTLPGAAGAPTLSPDGNQVAFA